MKKHVLQKVRGYKNPEVVKRIQSEFSLTTQEASALFEDTKLFLYLSTVSKQAISPTGNIDKGWHTFLMFTKDYAHFCYDCLGHFVHHVPFDSDYESDGSGVVNAIQLAEQHIQGHTTLSDNWTLNAAGDCAPDTNCEKPPSDCALNIEYKHYAWPTQDAISA